MMTFSEVSIYMFLMFALVGILLLVISLCFYKKYKSREKNCTSMIDGTVYKFANVDPISLPVVRYQVRGVTYKAMLRYRYITKSSRPGIEKTTLKDAANADVLRIRTNNAITTNPLMESYPIGSKMRVYYNPDKPKESYVLRLVRSSVVTVFWILGVAFVVAGIPFLVVYLTR